VNLIFQSFIQEKVDDRGLERVVACGRCPETLVDAIGTDRPLDEVLSEAALNPFPPILRSTVRDKGIRASVVHAQSPVPKIDDNPL
jgi:hypothetical protein